MCVHIDNIYYVAYDYWCNTCTSEVKLNPPPCQVSLDHSRSILLYEIELKYLDFQYENTS